ncbi:hypothetical protein [Pseudoalteromonas mariniglutinosa]|uniref:hypothetical protein n=1 Tax=Pseudoalteromonas mariniglutinosa TaxID=206042 RepID=UPI00384E5F28
MGHNKSKGALLAVCLILLSNSHRTLADKDQAEKNYDFDDKVHYTQTELSDNNYYLEIQSDDYKHFKNQSAFLLRHANRLCRDQPFMLKVTDGVQEFERFPTKPRAYQPPLTVLLQCDTKPTKE